jgi:hypothetical protein
VSRRYAVLVVEGPSDQAVVARALRLLGFKSFTGNIDELDTFWRHKADIVPKYPPMSGNLYERLPMPSILSTDSASIAVYSGGGSKLVRQIEALFENHDLHHALDAFGVVADADDKPAAAVAARYQKAFKGPVSGLPWDTWRASSRAPRARRLRAPGQHSCGRGRASRARVRRSRLRRADRASTTLRGRIQSTGSPAGAMGPLRRGKGRRCIRRQLAQAGQDEHREPRRQRVDREEDRAPPHARGAAPLPASARPGRDPRVAPPPPNPTRPARTPRASRLVCLPFPRPYG